MIGLNKIEDFLIDDNFIDYILAPNTILETYWNTFFHEHPECTAIAEKARLILLEEDNQQCLPDTEALDLKNRIFRTITAFN